MHEVLQLDGKVKKSIELPEVFNAEVNMPVIRRALLAEITHNLQPQGHDILAGMKTTAAYYGAMSSYRTGRHMGIAIRPREKLGGGVQGKVKRIPSAVKGKRAHPHVIEKRLVERINKKEYQSAIESALSYSKFGINSQKIKQAPIIFTDEIERISKTKELVKVLKDNGLFGFIEASKKPKIREGLRRSARVRHYKKSILFVFSKNASALKAARNLPGADACDVSSLSVSKLVPGGSEKRITIWSESAVNAIAAAIKEYNLHNK
ncbi:MAG: 50S ribosomal protein L4 [Candidatus Micrarchaeia archaeon]